MQIAKANGGFVTSGEVTAAGIQRRELTAAVTAGKLVRADRGFYCLPEAWEDEYAIVQHRYARGIFSHDTALYLLELSDQAPEALTMTFPHGYNTTPAKAFGVVPRTVATDLIDMGKKLLTTPYGNKVTAYDAERALCDMFRGAAVPDKQRLNPAFKAYLSSSKRDLLKLQDYAKKLGVFKKAREYLEVLL